MILMIDDDLLLAAPPRCLAAWAAQGDAVVAPVL